jgi:hypothetical protein
MCAMPLCCFEAKWLSFKLKTRPKTTFRFSPGVNFTNILQAAFSYKGFLRSFYVLTIWVCNFLVKGFWRKSCS